MCLTENEWWAIHFSSFKNNASFMQLAGATCLYYISLIFETSKKLTLHFVIVAISLVAAMADHIILIKCNMLHLLSVMDVLDNITENR